MVKNMRLVWVYFKLILREALINVKGEGGERLLKYGQKRLKVFISVAGRQFQITKTEING